MNIKELLAAMVEQGATDIIFSAGTPPCVRVQGEITPYGQQVCTAEFVEAVLATFLNDDQEAQFGIANELDFSVTVRGVGRFRVNAYRQKGTPSIAMRTVMASIPTFEALNLPKSMKGLLDFDDGLVCITGPSGSGKSATLAACVDEINRTRRSHIITIEKPIEYIHPMKLSLVEQREIGRDTMSVLDALVHVVRQAPDVIVVGDLADLETIAAVLKIAETGHLVLATLNTKSVGQTVDRLVEVFPSYQLQQVRTQLGWTLRGVVSQQLLPSAQGTGLWPACEVMMVNQAIKKHIADGKSYLIENTIEEGSTQGMMTMDSSIAALVDAGRVTEAVAVSRMHDPQNAQMTTTTLSRARELEKMLYANHALEQHKAEEELKLLRQQGSSEATEILDQFTRFTGQG